MSQRVGGDRLTLVVTSSWAVVHRARRTLDRAEWTTRMERLSWDPTDSPIRSQEARCPTLLPPRSRALKPLETATIKMQTLTETMRDNANSSEQSTGATREESYTQDERNVQTLTETIRDDANSSEQSTGATREEPYTQDEINVLRKRDLVQLIERQPEKWPHKYVKPAHSTVNALKSSLLDPGCGFMKTVLYDIAADEGNGKVSGGEGDVVNMTDDAELQLEHRDDRDGGELSPDGQEHPIDELGDDRQFVQIFIDDCRPTAANPQTSCGVHLTEVGREGCSENQWHVGTGELLQQLQRSSGAIEGTGESCCGSCGCPVPHAAATALPPG
ncbi:hypothetical protein PAXINDRAFT_7816 [Paxillus involutus ATCC 200175]|nr:hypothetical protein PAXINDRAFT_7816 [Paxillus involutus ATCC 200175]